MQGYIEDDDDEDDDYDGGDVCVCVCVCRQITDNCICAGSTRT